MEKIEVEETSNNFAAVFRNLVLLLLPSDCYDEFFVNFNFLHGPCLKIAFIKGLGYGIIFGASLVKVPQIIKLTRAKSSEGVNFYAVLLELTAITSTAGYSYANKYPFSSWGESLFLMLETGTIAFLVLYYNGNFSGASGFLAVFVASVGLLFSEAIPMNVLWMMQAANLPIVIVAKLLQIVENFKNGHTGQLSAVTYTLLSLGSFSRIFTSLSETGDTLIVVTFAIASFLNALCTGQIYYYWNKTNEILKAKKM